MWPRLRELRDGSDIQCVLGKLSASVQLGPSIFSVRAKH